MSELIRISMNRYRVVRGAAKIAQQLRDCRDAGGMPSGKLLTLAAELADVAAEIGGAVGVEHRARPNSRKRRSMRRAAEHATGGEGDGR